ncbi:OPT family oligopeptide transporter [Hyalangium rubrum]|uniref:OPT family oligopeptide transporter n=1 Tax=Hyalangium rubrum TaxID=3103134 RepID=A0ABU5H4E5_9BACT|nr:OPT family oligopeptide transporter [Hyalangium sp. s54d21]MDY7228350.1 OPT family oligopeptide transporter [Hyalangium sp. s54d21]
MARPVSRLEPAPPAPAASMLLRIPGTDPREVDTFWIREVFRADRVPQFTLRAVLLGSAMGVVACAVNLYAGLKTGIIPGVAIMAGLITYVSHDAMRRLTRGMPLSPLETCCAQAVASAAGYATGSALVSSQGAYLLLTGHHPPGWTLLAWTFVLSALGVFFAVPLKRQFIDREQLPFATGTAAALTVRALHDTDTEGRPRLRSLGLGVLVSSLVTTGRDALQLMAYTVSFPGRQGGVPLERLGFGLDLSLMLMGSGALLGLRITASALLGGLLMYGGVAPRLVAAGILPPDAELSTFREWSMWPAAAVFISAALLRLVLQGPALFRALRSLASSRDASAPHPVDALQIPQRWWVGGVVVLVPATVALAKVGFGVPVLHATLSVALSFILALIAGRITGETDVTPADALGSVTQLTSNLLQPRDAAAGLVTAGITVNTACSAADLLSDLKTGHLLGAHPRWQFLAQLLGSAVGAAAVVPLFYLLVPSPSALGGEQFPAPGVTAAAKLAQVLSTGLGSLPPSLLVASGCAALLAVLLTGVEHLLPERARRWVPSPVGLGLGFLLPLSATISIWLGGLVAEGVRRTRPVAWERRFLPLATGFIAGEGLMGVALLLLG